MFAVLVLQIDYEEFLRVWGIESAPQWADQETLPVLPMSPTNK